MTDTFGRLAAGPDSSNLNTLPNQPGAASPSPVVGLPSVYSFLSPPLEPDELGRLGNYRILKLLGKGGMGMVFLAEDLTLHRPVALKVMKPELAHDQEASSRFLREARAMAAIKHDHLATVYQVDQEGATVFLAMELLEGENLETFIQRTSKPQLADILRIGREIAIGLDAMHRRGLIHRDLKPSNIWLEDRSPLSVVRTLKPMGQGPESGARKKGAGQHAPSQSIGLAPETRPVTTNYRVKILDFGLVRDASKQGWDTELTGAGVLLGTPAFWSPEQARGKVADHRSDLFSLGGVLYRLCTGSYAFPAANNLEQLAAVAADEPTPIHQHNAGLPASLVALVMELLAKDPDKRPASAAEVAERLLKIKKHSNAKGRAGVERIAGEAAAEPATERLSAPIKAKSKGGKKKNSAKSKWLLIAGVVGVVTVASIITVSMANLLARPQNGDKKANGDVGAKKEAGSETVSVLKLPKAKTVNWPFHTPPKEEGKGKAPKGPPPELNGPVKFRGEVAPQGIFMHPAPGHDQPASITYDLGGAYTHFGSRVSLADTGPVSASPLTFNVYGDGKVLWSSTPLTTQKETQTCKVSVAGVQQLKIEVQAAGDVRKTHAIWVDPVLKK